MDRWMLVGDSHGCTPMLREALRVAEHLDIPQVVSVGDFGLYNDSQGRNFLDAIQHAAAQRNRYVKAVPGNHEDYGWLETLPVNAEGWLVVRPNILAAPRGHIFEGPNGQIWLACGGAASIDGPGGVGYQTIGPTVLPGGYTKDLGGWWPQERVTLDNVETSLQAAAGRHVDVFVTHDAPIAASLPAADFWPEGEVSRAHLQTIVDAVNPTLNVAGHWHHWNESSLPNGTRAFILSADVNPDEPQWAVVSGTSGDPELWVPEWSTKMALTRILRQTERLLEYDKRHRTNVGHVELIKMFPYAA